MVCADPLMRAQLAGLIGAGSVTLVEAWPSSGLAAARICAVVRPDVVVLDAVEPGGDHDVLGIASASPSTAVVVFTARADRRSSLRLLDAGAAAVVAKGDGADLQGALDTLVSGKAA